MIIYYAQPHSTLSTKIVGFLGAKISCLCFKEGIKFLFKKG